MRISKITLFFDITTVYVTYTPQVPSKSNVVKNKTQLHTVLLFFSHLDVYYLRSVHHLLLVLRPTSHLLQLLSHQLATISLAGHSSTAVLSESSAHSHIYSVTPSPTVGHSPGAFVGVASAEGPVGQHQSSSLSLSRYSWPATD